MSASSCPSRALALAGLLAACGADDPGADPDEELSAGPATVFDSSSSAFSNPIPGLDRDAERAFFRGRALFRDDWVTAPSSTMSRDGLGPIFNARSCQACHVDDGRGRPPLGGEETGSLLFRLSAPGGGPEPTYGGQLQPLAILGLAGEGQVVISHAEIPGSFGDGEPHSLAAPTYELADLSYGPMVDGVLVSPRVAPAMIGLGLLERVPESAIAGLADPDDGDGDGISGRVNRPVDVATGEPALGRFGWKSNQPSIRQQTAGAFNGDIGITSSLFSSDDCTAAETDCSGAASGGDPELLDAILDDVTAYSRLLAVPARRDHDDPAVLRGKALFAAHGCAGCHAPSLPCDGIDELDAGPFTIRPYTDLLVHDMGAGLADDRPDVDAGGSEWRTPPLWGLGLIERVNLHTFLLHDGRARDVTEAILWHGGEGEAAREAFRLSSAAERADLLRFLESL